VLLDVLIVNVAEVIPASILTVAGTFAELMLLDRVTVIPPTGAGEEIRTVPIADFPPATDAGFIVKD